MIAEAAVSLGRRIAGHATAGADSYWAARVWDREACGDEPVLGPHYRIETMEICALVRAQVSYLAQSPVRRAIEVGCGVGVFTAELLASEIDEVVALDISAGALERTRERVGDDPRLRTVLADVRSYHPPLCDDGARGDGLFDVLVCVDTLHHIGDPVLALDAMSRFVRPGGVMIGNIWTADHFHEFQRLRRGPARHAAASLAFCASAIANRIGYAASSTRTELIHAEVAREQLAALFDLLHVSQSRYWVRFAVRR